MDYEMDESEARYEAERDSFAEWLKDHGLDLWDLSSREERQMWSEYQDALRYRFAFQDAMFGVSDSDFR